MRPIFIPRKIQAIVAGQPAVAEQIQTVKKAYRALRKIDTPRVTVVIPAYNEEKNILATLQSLASNKTAKPVEIIVVNNNSTDKTEELVNACGIPCVTELKKGITAARTAGLHNASGKYILNADADAIYPQCWIDEMIDPMETNPEIALTYGRFSFIPVGSTGRFSYFIYEHFADMLRYFNKYVREEAVNVYGFNSGYKRSDGFLVDGYSHPKGANEDGYLALKLRNNGLGRLHYVTKSKALVWTSDRRLQMEGGFIKGVRVRIAKFFFPRQFTQLRTDL